MLLELGLLVYVTNRTLEYVILATNKGVAGLDIVAVATVIQAPFIALLGYTFNLYAKDRLTNADTNNPSLEIPIARPSDILAARVRNSLDLQQWEGSGADSVGIERTETVSELPKRTRRKTTRTDKQGSRIPDQPSQDGERP